MRLPIEIARRRFAGIDDDEALAGLQPLKAGIGRLRRGAFLGFGARQNEIDKNAILLDRIVEQREPAVAMPEQPRYRRHALDRVLHRWRLDPRGAQRGADVDQIAQHLELHRRVAGAVSAIGQNLPLQFALQQAQGPRDPSLRPAECHQTAEQPLQGAQLRRSGAFPGCDARQMPHLRRQAPQHGAPQRPVGVAAGEFVEMHDPGEDSRRQHIRAPTDRVPCRALAEPAVDQRAGGLARLIAGAGQIGQPAEPVPGGEPFQAG